ncbi:MAG TPA: helix-turn-helix domain-containing protein, partial [Desulfosarcina sp.]|nr:helix-turn-helix domain-containing protein [Desulfosarcina sp.]
MKLSIKRVAGALELPATTVERWIRQGRIPIQRSGTDAIFSRPALERWADAHKLSFSLEGGRNEANVTELSDALVPAMRRG